MGRFALVALLCAVAGYVHAPSAKACGGFFCGTQPVDQTAERIVFRVNDDSTTMVVQIAYAGEAKDFVADGNLQLDGNLPCNTNGGLIGEGYIHGLNLATEATRQLRGTAINQVDGAQHALVSASRTGIILGRA